MITATQIPLPEKRSEAVKSWLNKPECNFLIEIVEAMQKTHEAKMTAAAAESAEYPAKLCAANDHLISAGRYDNFLKVLAELKENPDPFTTIKLT